MAGSEGDGVGDRLGMLGVGAGNTAAALLLSLVTGSLLLCQSLRIGAGASQTLSIRSRAEVSVDSTRECGV